MQRFGDEDTGHEHHHREGDGSRQHHVQKPTGHWHDKHHDNAHHTKREGYVRGANATEDGIQVEAAQRAAATPILWVIA
ncbi:hypothetical protein [Kordiimonas gwangyangensis]|uniref:hypothetical protein n=1 Tax=Kordiimonas gwangyangensis TaxID=288022 RepID=UPI00046F64C5|nr:hypothetical protein [Kordiimonas gwangyangensis]